MTQANAPADTTRPATDLGEIRTVFRPDTANIIAGYILGLLATIGGVLFIAGISRVVMREWRTMPFAAEKGMSWVAVIVFYLIGVALLVGAFFLVRWVRRLSTHQVVIYAGGIGYVHHDTFEQAPWVEVAEIIEVIAHERAPILKGAAKALIPRKTSRSYALCLRGDKTYEFTPNTVKNVDSLGELLRAEAEQRSIPWRVEEIDVG